MASNGFRELKQLEKESGVLSQQVHIVNKVEARNIYNYRKSIMQIHASYGERINNVLVYIHCHLGEKIDLEHISSVAHISPYHFHRIISAFLHEPLGGYITRLRLNKAANMLINTAHNVTSIGYEVGFEDLSSFSKAFKKQFNFSPLKYRMMKNLFVLETIDSIKIPALDI